MEKWCCSLEVEKNEEEKKKSYSAGNKKNKLK